MLLFGLEGSCFYPEVAFSFPHPTPAMQLFPSTIYRMYFFPPITHLHEIYSTPIKS